VVDGWSLERIVTRARRRRRGAGARLDARSVIEAGRPDGAPAICRCGHCGGVLRYPTRRLHAPATLVVVVMRCPDCGAEDSEDF
jgi:hypothetical protein